MGRGRRRVVVALALVLVAGGVLAAIALRTRPAPVPNGDRGNWHLIFDDAFNGTSLDQAHWSTGWFGSGVTWPVNPTVSECFDPRRVSVGGGSLSVSVAIKPEFCEGKTRRYSAGIVTSDGKFSYTYGFAQIRARVAVSRSGVVYDWPSFWTASN